MTPMKLADRLTRMIDGVPEGAMITFHADVVREVYRVAKWLPAGSTLRADYPEGLPREEPRWEFVGRRAEESLRQRYADGYVGGFFKRGNQNPILYLNVD